jgi:hypothetical protein
MTLQRSAETERIASKDLTAITRKSRFTTHWPFSLFTAL